MSFSNNSNKHPKLAQIIIAVLIALLGIYFILGAPSFSNCFGHPDVCMSVVDLWWVTLPVFYGIIMLAQKLEVEHLKKSGITPYKPPKDIRTLQKNISFSDLVQKIGIGQREYLLSPLFLVIGYWFCIWCWGCMGSPLHRMLPVWGAIALFCSIVSFKEIPLMERAIFLVLFVLTKIALNTLTFGNAAILGIALVIIMGGAILVDTGAWRKEPYISLYKKIHPSWEILSSLLCGIVIVRIIAWVAYSIGSFVYKYHAIADSMEGCFL